MAIPCPPNAIRNSTIAGEFGVALSNSQLSRKLAPYIGKSYGTRVSHKDFCGASANAGPEANGGTEWYNPNNGYTNHIFTTNTDFCVTKAGVGGTDQTTIRVLATGGGGGGGSGGVDAREKREFGGGGGAGGLLETTIPNAVACYSHAIGAGGYGASAVELARGGTGGSTIARNKSTNVATVNLGGGGGGGSMYNGQWDGGYGASGGGGGGKYQGTNGTVGGNGSAPQGNKGGAGGSGGAGAGGGHRTNGNGQDFANQAGGSGGGGTTYDPMSKPYSVGGAGAGWYSGGSGYNMAGDGGTSMGGRGTATAATREGCGGGGGGAGGHPNGGENGKNGKNGIVVYSYKK